MAADILPYMTECVVTGLWKVTDALCVVYSGLN